MERTKINNPLYTKEFVDGRIILDPQEKKYDPSTLSLFIDKFFPEDIKYRIVQLTQS